MLKRVSQCVITFVVLAVPAAAAAQTPAVTVEYHHLDAVGSVRAVTDASAAIVRRHDYFPFGDGPVDVAAEADPVRFGGKARDRETGLDYFGARYYASRSGRFTTVDPGHVGGNIFDPQSWNAYAYARNNPLKYVDPTGTTYEICGYNESGGIGSCGSVSDEYFGSLSRTASGHGMRLFGGTIWVGDRAVGSYWQTSVDPTFNSFINQTGQLADRWLKESLTDMAVGTAFAAGGGLVAGALGGGLASEGLSITSRAALDANKLNHIFGKAAHNLGPLVARFGSQAAAHAALERATQAAVRSQGLSGVYRVTVNVGGQAVEVTGKVVNGIVRIGTAYIR